MHRKPGFLFCLKSYLARGRISQGEVDRGPIRKLLKGISAFLRVSAWGLGIEGTPTQHLKGLKPVLDACPYPNTETGDIYGNVTRWSRLLILVPKGQRVVVAVMTGGRHGERMDPVFTALPPVRWKTGPTLGSSGQGSCQPVCAPNGGMGAPGRIFRGEGCLKVVSQAQAGFLDSGRVMVAAARVRSIAGVIDLGRGQSVWDMGSPFSVRRANTH